MIYKGVDEEGVGLGETGGCAHVIRDGSWVLA